MTELFASVDLGGTKTSCGIGTSDGHLVREKSIPTRAHEGAEAVLRRTADLVHELAGDLSDKPIALGIGLPGLVDPKSGVSKFLPNLPTQWREIPVGDTLRHLVGCPIYMLNDVRMATLGELTYGHGRREGTMVFFSLGTGIGGGIALNGRLWLGPQGTAGELGHQTILPDGPLCGCGNQGCLETLASGPAIIAQGIWLLLSGRAPKLHDLVNGDVALITPKVMMAAAEGGDWAVHQTLVRCAQYIGIGVANVVTILHPALIVLGGGVSEMGPLLLDTVRETVHNRVRMFPVDDVQIDRSLLGDKAGLLGGIALAAERGLGDLHERD